MLAILAALVITSLTVASNVEQDYITYRTSFSFFRSSSAKEFMDAKATDHPEFILRQYSGLWLGLEERDRQIRTSCSLSMLHNPQFSVVRGSKSSENLQKVDHAPVVQKSPAVKKSSIFTLRKSRAKEKKAMKPSATLSNGINTVDPLMQSWHSQANGHHTTKTILSFLRPSRSRSSTNNDLVVVSRPIPSCPNSSTVADFSHLRKRRPRSAHYDPNTITLSEKQDYPEQDVSETYERLEKLGEGSYATVYKCRSKIDGSTVALKEIKLQFQEGLPFTAIREASLLRALRHANIVCLHDIFHQHNQLTFVFEYMKMDLSKYLERHPTGVDGYKIKLLLFQLLRGLDFCHRKKILHRDLKPQNLLLDDVGV